MHICVCILMYMYSSVDMCINTCIHIYIYICICMSVCKHVPMYFNITISLYKSMFVSCLCMSLLGVSVRLPHHPFPTKKWSIRLGRTVSAKILKLHDMTRLRSSSDEL